MAVWSVLMLITVDDRVQRRLLITGYVQGVGYRISAARMADQFALSGTVRNLEDGSVEVLVAGPSESVEKYIAWCRVGPRGAQVDEVAVSPELAPGEAVVDGVFRVVG